MLPILLIYSSTLIEFSLSMIQNQQLYRVISNYSHLLTVQEYHKYRSFIFNSSLVVRRASIRFKRLLNRSKVDRINVSIYSPSQSS